MGSDPPVRTAALLGSGLALALDSITEPWCNAILRAAFLGVRTFDGFLQTLGLPRQTLSVKLRYLCRIGLLEPSPRDRTGVKPGYRLTETGKSLYPNVLASWSWDRCWGHFTGRLPTRLNHRPCGHAFIPQWVCEHCALPMTPGNSTALLVSEAVHRPVRIRGRYRGHTHSRQAEPGRRDLLAVIDDRWSVLLITAALLGLNHFDDFYTALSISSAVLAQRLQRLCELQLMQRQPDPADARRTQYRLTTSGQDLMAYLATLNAWGMRGQAAESRSSLQWRHQVCGRLSQGRMACPHCDQTLVPQQVFGTYAEQASDPLPTDVRQTSPSTAQPRKRRRVSANANQKLLPA